MDRSSHLIRLTGATCAGAKTKRVVRSPDLVASLHSDPLGNGPVLFLLLGEEALNPECLVGRLANERNTTLSVQVSLRFHSTYSRKCIFTKWELVANISTERYRLTCVAAQSRYRLASLSFILL